MLQLNLWFGWCWVTVGLISGAILGLFFHDPNWLGGYETWRRRMVRLGHISFLGTGLLNIALALSLLLPEGLHPPSISGWLFIVGAATMPLVCFLSAWRDSFRFLFPIPVASLIGASLTLVWQRLL